MGIVKSVNLSAYFLSIAAAHLKCNVVSFSSFYFLFQPIMEEGLKPSSKIVLKCVHEMDKLKEQSISI